MNIDSSKPTRILLVEDSPAHQLPLTTALLAEGFEVEVAESVKDADTTMAEAHYDLLIVDIRLPRHLEGIDFVEQVREREKKARVGPSEEIRVIFTTVLNHEATSPRIAALRHDDYFVKPFDVAKVVLRVKELLKPWEVKK